MSKRNAPRTAMMLPAMIYAHMAQLDIVNIRGEINTHLPELQPCYTVARDLECNMWVSQKAGQSSCGVFCLLEVPEIDHPGHLVLLYLQKPLHISKEERIPWPGCGTCHMAITNCNCSPHHLHTFSNLAAGLDCRHSKDGREVSDQPRL